MSIDLLKTIAAAASTADILRKQITAISETCDPSSDLWLQMIDAEGKANLVRSILVDAEKDATAQLEAQPAPPRPIPASLTPEGIEAALTGLHRAAEVSHTLNAVMQIRAQEENA